MRILGWVLIILGFIGFASNSIDFLMSSPLIIQSGINPQLINPTANLSVVVIALAIRNRSFWYGKRILGWFLIILGLIGFTSNWEDFVLLSLLHTNTGIAPNLINPAASVIVGLIGFVLIRSIKLKPNSRNKSANKVNLDKDEREFLNELKGEELETVTTELIEAKSKNLGSAHLAIRTNEDDHVFIVNISFPNEGQKPWWGPKEAEFAEKVESGEIEKSEALPQFFSKMIVEMATDFAECVAIRMDEGNRSFLFVNDGSNGKDYIALNPEGGRTISPAVKSNILDKLTNYKGNGGVIIEDFGIQIAMTITGINHWDYNFIKLSSCYEGHLDIAGYYEKINQLSSQKYDDGDIDTGIEFYLEDGEGLGQDGDPYGPKYIKDYFGCTEKDFDLKIFDNEIDATFQSSAKNFTREVEASDGDKIMDLDSPISNSGITMVGILSCGTKSAECSLNFEKEELENYEVFTIRDFFEKSDDPDFDEYRGTRFYNRETSWIEESEANNSFWLNSREDEDNDGFQWEHKDPVVEKLHSNWNKELYS